MRATPLTHYLTHQLEQAKCLLEKIGPDDPDHLHQFRVALRKVRALLRLFLPHAKLVTKTFKKLIRQTNQLREIDVLLDSLDVTTYPNAYQTLIHLRDDAYQSTVNESFFRDFEQEIGSLHSRLLELNPGMDPLSMIDHTQTYYDKTLTLYKRLPKNAVPKQFHPIRIGFKICRYGLECLEDLEIQHKVKKILQCKRVQNHLGNLCDIHNQVKWLKQHAEQGGYEEFKPVLYEWKKRLKKAITSKKSV